MRLFSLYFLVLILLVGCRVKEHRESEAGVQSEEEVEAVLTSFFEAISDYDYQTLRDLTADDYTLIENGPIWTLDSLITFMQQNENRIAFSYKLTKMETTVEGQTAWMTYKNNGLMTMPDKERNFDWTESAVFHKKGDEWKMVLLHSTMN